MPDSPPLDTAPSFTRLVDLLSEVYKDEGIAIWLKAPQFHGKSAIDLIAGGALEHVLARAEYLAGGAW